MTSSPRFERALAGRTVGSSCPDGAIVTIETIYTLIALRRAIRCALIFNGYYRFPTRYSAVASRIATTSASVLNVVPP